MPLLYAGCLYAASESLTRRQPPTPLSEAMLFLIAGYRPETYWWQMVDVARKLVLIGLLALFEPGSLLRSYIGVIVAASFLTLEAYIGPNSSKLNHFLATFAAFALFLILLGVLGLELVSIQTAEENAVRYQEERGSSEFENGETEFGANTTSDVELSVLLGAVLVVLVVALWVLAKAILMSYFSPRLRSVRTGSEVIPRPLRKHHHHVLLSHHWASGQEQAKSIQKALTDLAPDLEVFVETEDVLDLGNFEANVAKSDSLIVFLSGSADRSSGGCPTKAVRSDYFHNPSCLRELRAAVDGGKPICFVAETDPRHGAVAIEVHRRECAALVPEFETLFDTHPIVPWIRTRGYQQVSLRQMIETIIGEALYVNTEVIRQPLELQPVTAPHSFHLYVSPHNHGAEGVALLLAAEVQAMGGEGHLRVTQDPGALQQSAGMLCYCSAGSSSPALDAELEAMLRDKRPVLVLHEQRPGEGAMPFDALIERTPSALQELGIFRTVVHPLHESEDHLHVGLRLALRSLGARRPDLLRVRILGPRLGLHVPLEIVDEIAVSLQEIRHGSSKEGISPEGSQRISRRKSASSPELAQRLRRVSESTNPIVRRFTGQARRSVDDLRGSGSTQELGCSSNALEMVAVQRRSLEEVPAGSQYPERALASKDHSGSSPMTGPPAQAGLLVLREATDEGRGSNLRKRSASAPLSPLQPSHIASGAVFPETDLQRTNLRFRQTSENSSAAGSPPGSRRDSRGRPPVDEPRPAQQQRWGLSGLRSSLSSLLRGSIDSRGRERPSPMSSLQSSCSGVAVTPERQATPPERQQNGQGRRRCGSGAVPPAGSIKPVRISSGATYPTHPGQQDNLVVRSSGKHVLSSIAQEHSERTSMVQPGTEASDDQAGSRSIRDV